MGALSLWSEDSFLSIASTGSVLSIGSAGSVLSIGSVGSALSFASVGSTLSSFSAGSVLSVGSALSARSRWSLLSSGGDHDVLARRVPPIPSLHVVGGAALALALLAAVSGARARRLATARGHRRADVRTCGLRAGPRPRARP
ncbi:MAG TPA: hypothetical protein VGG83_16075 [Trebonia sp.]